jgi:hypothetical protein
MRYIILLLLVSCGQTTSFDHPQFLGEFEVDTISNCDSKGVCGLRLIKYESTYSAYEYATGVFPNVGERCYLYQTSFSKFCRWGVL